MLIVDNLANSDKQLTQVSSGLRFSFCHLPFDAKSAEMDVSFCALQVRKLRKNTRILQFVKSRRHTD